MDAMPVPDAAPRVPRALPCVLASLLLAVAPACLAQDAALAVEREGASADVAAAPTAQPVAEARPRSAFGRVMSLMIAALQENAERPQAAGFAPADEPVTGGHAGGDVQKIQVSAAFRLDPPTPDGNARAPTAPLAAAAPQGD